MAFFKNESSNNSNLNSERQPQPLKNQKQMEFYQPSGGDSCSEGKRETTNVAQWHLREITIVLHIQHNDQQLQQQLIYGNSSWQLEQPAKPSSIDWCQRRNAC